MTNIHQAQSFVIGWINDENYTYRIPYRGRYYFYTYIDGSLRLCGLGDIPATEKQEIFNAMANNDNFIDDNFGAEKKEDAKTEA